VTLILECCENTQKHHAAVYEKYCDKRYKKASIFAQAEVRSTLERLRIERDLGLHRQLR
jgi:G2/mitotic-specific cyclin 3/4